MRDVGGGAGEECQFLPYEVALPLAYRYTGAILLWPAGGKVGSASSVPFLSLTYLF